MGADQDLPALRRGQHRTCRGQKRRPLKHSLVLAAQLVRGARAAQAAMDAALLAERRAAIAAAAAVTATVAGVSAEIESRCGELWQALSDATRRGSTS